MYINVICNSSSMCDHDIKKNKIKYLAHSSTQKLYKKICHSIKFLHLLPITVTLVIYSTKNRNICMLTSNS